MAATASACGRGQGRDATAPPHWHPLSGMLCRCRCGWSRASGRHCSRAALAPGGPAAVASNLKGSLRVPEGKVPTAGSVTQTRVGWARDSGIRPGHTGGPVPLLQFGPPRSLNILPKTVNHTMSTRQMLYPHATWNPRRYGPRRVRHPLPPTCGGANDPYHVPRYPRVRALCSTPSELV
jgi:hypothetical protein